MPYHRDARAVDGSRPRPLLPDQREIENRRHIGEANFAGLAKVHAKCTPATGKKVERRRPAVVRCNDHIAVTRQMAAQERRLPSVAEIPCENTTSGKLPRRGVAWRTAVWD